MLAALGHKQQQCARGDRRHANPDRHIDGLTVADRQFERAYLGLLGLLGVGKAAIGQPQCTSDDQCPVKDTVIIALGKGETKNEN